MAAIHDWESLYTIGFDPYAPEVETITGRQVKGPNDASFDLAIIELDDQGRFERPVQLERAAEWITASRQGAFVKDGVVVVVFVHGWHHGARLDDPHLREFRRVLRALAIREMERSDSRRVIGVYLAWNGDPRWYPFSRVPVLTDVSFYSRYRTARRISRSAHCHETLRTIIVRTKQSPDGSVLIPSQLVLVGHSMGGLIVESALQKLIEDHVLLGEAQPSRSLSVKTEISGQQVVFPDAVLSLNSAANSGIIRNIGGLLEERRVSKSGRAGSVGYAPPLLISATSTADSATRVWWRIANPLSRTTGHDRALLTHDFGVAEKDVEATPIPGRPDFGQTFHVLRPPDPLDSKTPRMHVDLPDRERTGTKDLPQFDRYRLEPRGRRDTACRIWNFQLPGELVKDHNDIFNPRTSSLILALMQISGTVGSLAPDWEHSFEPYPKPASPGKSLK